MGVGRVSKQPSQFPYFREFVDSAVGNWESFQPHNVEKPAEELAIVMKAVVEGTVSLGVGLTHKNLSHVLARYDSLFPPGTISSDVILMVQKVIWMSGIYTLLLACYYGAKMIVIGEFDEELVLKSIESHKVTMCFLYPAKIWQLYKYSYKRKYDLSSCRIYGVGARLQRVLMKGMKEKTGIDVRPAYGITEMSGIILDPVMGEKEGSIGKLVPECFAKVVSIQTHQRLGPNSPGELCFKGPVMMKAYVNDEKATRAAIDKDGFICSGDYGSFDEEGFFFIVDKIKQVILYRNHKLSPQEIEGVIKTMEQVKDCVVGGIPHSADGFRTIAFVVLDSGSTATAKDIIEYVANKLPEHKHLKGGVVFIPKVPRSKESGVIKRHVVNKILAKYQLLDKKQELPALDDLKPKPTTEASKDSPKKQQKERPQKEENEKEKSQKNGGGSKPQ